MVKYADLEINTDGRLAANITHFARALRRAGVPVGSGQILDAIRAIEAAGFSDRGDFFWALHACFVRKREQSPLFAQVFRLYWRDPQFLEHMMSMLTPMVRGVNEPPPSAAAERRAAEALLDDTRPPPPAEAVPEEGEHIEIDASLTFSASEMLRAMDFEQMTLSELRVAKRAIAQIALPVRPLPSRRTVYARRGTEIDPRATLRSAMRQGGEVMRLHHKTRRERWPNLVVLCDISGSMSGYSRMLLHFVHAAANAKGAGWARVHAFTFGTRLTNITRHLRQRDVDAALAACGQEALDWEGGTRIGAALESFNRDWSRRVLGQGAVVLLITDGLDREDPQALARAAERIRLSSRRFIWLNPLLRWEGFAPKAGGIKALLPQVDTFLASHNINALTDLAQTLSHPEDTGEKARLMALL